MLESYRMIRYRKIFVSLLFVGAAMTANADRMDFSSDALFYESQEAEVTLTVVVNEDAEVKMENVVKKGYLEVYNLLGVKVTSVNLKECTDDKCNIELAKGLYILKAGKVAKKIIVK